MKTKICCACKIEKKENEFFKNKTRKDGFQNYCKSCSKSKWGKWFDCSSCGNNFYVGHRNVSRRKTRLCRKCVKEFQTQRIIKQNKLSANEFILNKKGYKYVRDLKEKHGYKFVHRKKIEENIGRSLTKDEVVHHIDGDKLNNELENLFLTNKLGHAEAHNSLEKIAFLLVRNGTIKFNKNQGKYEL